MNSELAKKIFVFELKCYKQYWNLTRRVLRRLKQNKTHREQRINRIVKRKMKHLK